MLRPRSLRALAVAPVLFLAACGDCNNPCTSGVSFYVSALAGSLAPGSSVPLTICFDGDCRDTTITRANEAGTVFMPFKAITKSGDHRITVSGPDGLSGSYTGPLEGFEQPATDSSCSACTLGAVKIGADGTLTPGTAATPSPTTTTGG